MLITSRPDTRLFCLGVVVVQYDLDVRICYQIAC